MVIRRIYPFVDVDVVLFHVLLVYPARPVDGQQRLVRRVISGHVQVPPHSGAHAEKRAEGGVQNSAVTLVSESLVDYGSSVTDLFGCLIARGVLVQSGQDMWWDHVTGALCKEKDGGKK